jgi:dCMP deaminase
MVSQRQLDLTYMDVAKSFASLSKARRKKVGAVIVFPNGIMAPGFNGTASGDDNNCEDEIEDYEIVCESGGTPPMAWAGISHRPITRLVTKPDVLHAESNAFAKVMRSTNSTEGATLYITLSPCRDCAKLIKQGGITRVVYAEMYRTDDGVDKPEGIDYLTKRNIKVEQL